MAKDLYVRVKPKSGSTQFYRCALLHTLLWVLHEGLDNATAEALENEQMLETSKTKPADFDAQQAEVLAAEAEAAIETHGDNALIGSGELPSVLTVAEGYEITLGELVSGAFADSRLTVEGWNGLPQADRELILQGAFEDIQAIHAAAASEADALKKAADAHANTVAGLNSQISGLNSQVSSLTSERDTARSTLATVTSERDGLNTTVSTLQSKVTSLEAELNAAKAEKPAGKKPASKA